LKNLRWARPISGQRSDILSWLRAQDAKIGQESFVEKGDTAVASDGEEVAGIEDGDSA